MKAMMEAQKHVDALKMIAEREGMSVEDLVEQVMGEEGGEGEEEGMDMGMEGEGQDMEKPSPDKAKIALIIARMKKKD